MPSKTIKCFIKGCTATGVTKNRFPNPAKRLELFNVWLDILDTEELRVLDPMVVYKSKRICFAHFDAKFKSLGNSYLHKNAVPFGRLTGFREPLQQLSTNLPSTSQTANMEDVGQAAPEFHPQEFQVSTPSTSARTMEICSTPTGLIINDKRCSLLKSMSTGRQQYLTPKSKKMYKKAVYWKHEAIRAKSSRKSFRQRLASAEKYGRMSVMTSSAQSFFNMQMRETKKSNRGRRFSVDEKIICLTLLKNSPRNYNLLHKLFTLPSARTLKIFLNQLYFKTGVNKKLFKALKKK